VFGDPDALLQGHAERWPRPDHNVIFKTGELILLQLKLSKYIVYTYEYIIYVNLYAWICTKLIRGLSLSLM